MKAKKTTIALIGGLISMVSMSFIIQQSNTWTAPKSANTLKNPYSDTNPTIIKDGQKTFKLFCISCHGQEGKGDGIAAASLIPRPADLLLSKTAKQSDGAIFWKITNGKAPMPSWKAGIPTAKRWQLVTYIRYLEHKYGKK